MRTDKTVDAQADLSLPWAHMLEGSFSAYLNLIVSKYNALYCKRVILRMKTADIRA